MSWNDIQRGSHLRFDPLRREWVLVSPQRTQRPWQGHIEPPLPVMRPTHDPGCYLCPGNERSGGKRNPAYASTFVFENDFPALQTDIAHAGYAPTDFIRARSERGVCRVMCFSPRHDLDVPRMSVQDLRRVVDAWTDAYEQLGGLPWIRHVQIFENRGASMGASSPHPHCQIWATQTLPNEAAAELEAMREFQSRTGACLLCSYLEWELSRQERVVCANASFVAVVPFWAVWPFETLVLSRRHAGALNDLTAGECTDLADLMRRLTSRYDNLFTTEFPYSMGLHQRPTDGEPHPSWHLHAHYYPPLLRSASVRKFMVGFELLGTPQRDLSPESAAARLQQAIDAHYSTRAAENARTED